MNVLGMDRETGMPLSGAAHLRQSITDLFTTRKGARRCRKDYGTLLPDMVDLPVTPGWIAAAQAEAARAIERFEPRLTLKKAVVIAVIDGRIHWHISGTYLGDDVFLEL